VQRIEEACLGADVEARADDRRAGLELRRRLPAHGGGREAPELVQGRRVRGRDGGGRADRGVLRAVQVLRPVRRRGERRRRDSRGDDESENPDRVAHSKTSGPSLPAPGAARLPDSRDDCHESSWVYSPKWYTWTSHWAKVSANVPRRTVTGRLLRYCLPFVIAAGSPRMVTFRVPLPLRAAITQMSPSPTLRLSISVVGSSVRSAGPVSGASSAGWSRPRGPISATSRRSTSSQNVQFQPRAASAGKRQWGVAPPKKIRPRAPLMIASLPAGSSLPLKQICKVVNTARPGVTLRIVRVHFPTWLRSGSATPKDTG